MAQEGYDELMALTDSRYRLTMITARRAAQLKSGIPSILDGETLPKTSNTVTVAMKELQVGQGIRWGDDLPDIEELSRGLERESRPDRSGFGRTIEQE